MLKRLASPLLVTTIVNVVLILLGVTGGVILARVLGPDARGELAAAVLWATMTPALSDLGIGFAVAYFARSPSRASSLAGTSVTIGLVLGGLVASGIALLAPLLVPAEAVPVLRALSPVIPVIICSGYLSFLLLGVGDLRSHNLVRIISSISYVAGVALLWQLRRLSPFTAAMGFLIAQGLGAVYAASKVLRLTSGKLHWEQVQARSLVVFGSKTHVASLAGHANLRLDQALLSMFFPAHQLGLYAVATSVGSVVGPVFTALATLVLAQGAQRTLGGGLARGVFLGVAVGVVALVVGLPALPWLVPAVFGSEFKAAVVPAQILLGASIFQGFNAYLGNALRSRGRPGAPSLAELGSLVVTLILLPFLLQRLGIRGAALASLVAYSVSTALLVYFIRAGPRGGHAVSSAENAS